MRSNRSLRYALFAFIFALVIVGLVIHSYPLLVTMIVLAIVVGVIADKIDNAPTEPFKHHNELHHHKH